MDHDIILRKLDSLARCVNRIEQKRPEKFEELVTNIDLQDILSINLERAIQVSVDIGAHLIAGLSVPPPQTMGQVFEILSNEKIITEQTGVALRKAVGFRNLSVHAYDQVDWEQVFVIIHQRMNEFRAFADAIRTIMKKS
ncbi:MAG: DUF86 domain-containing protein [Verrucomicrobia bacterium]|nr:MAG: DUF86 domain-containing protein [Verrucomicrobiota bacterium]